VSYKLLLADDSITIQRVIELTFSGEDVQVVAVGDGEQAIARIPGERPDVVLADIAMPKRSGYEVSAFVKGRPDLRHIPVLLLAGAFEPVDQARAEQVQCDGVLVKPFEPSQMIARVRELIDRPRTNAPPGPPPAGAARGGEASEEVSGVEAASVAPDARVAPAGPVKEPTPPLERPAREEAPPITDVGVDPVLEALDEVGAAGAPAAGVASALSAALNEVAGTARSEAVGEPGGPGSLADVFRALLAVERGDPGARQPEPPRPAGDEFVEEVTRRVLERLDPNAARSLLAAVVAEVAERVVHEEGRKR
jgi:CheY-like chemotaxis protein